MKKDSFCAFLCERWFSQFPWFLFLLGVFGLVCGTLFYQYEIAGLSLVPILISPVLCVLNCWSERRAERAIMKMVERKKNTGKL